jgi:hypothetical protein
MEKRVYTRFFGIFVFLILCFGLVFFIFSDVNDSSITGNVVGERSLEEVNESNLLDSGELIGDLEPTKDFDRIIEFLNDYDYLVEGWFDVYFSCLNKCPVNSKGDIEINCLNSCKSLSGDKESELKDDLNEKYTLEEIESYSDDPFFISITLKVDSLLVCLRDCFNNKICISECVSDLY